MAEKGLHNFHLLGLQIIMWTMQQTIIHHAKSFSCSTAIRSLNGPSKKRWWLKTWWLTYRPPDYHFQLPGIKRFMSCLQRVKHMTTLFYKTLSSHTAAHVFLSRQLWMSPWMTWISWRDRSASILKHQNSPWCSVIFHTFYGKKASFYLLFYIVPFNMKTTFHSFSYNTFISIFFVTKCRDIHWLIRSK